jgi:hypothetical protein
MYSTLQAIESLLSSGLVVDSTIMVDNSDVVAKLLDIYTRLGTTNSWLDDLRGTVGDNGQGLSLYQLLDAWYTQSQGYATEESLLTLASHLNAIRATSANTADRLAWGDPQKQAAQMLAEILYAQTVNNGIIADIKTALSFDYAPNVYGESVFGFLESLRDTLGDNGQGLSLYQMLDAWYTQSQGYATEESLEKIRFALRYDNIPATYQDSIAGKLDALAECCDEMQSSNVYAPEVTPTLPPPRPDDPGGTGPPSDLCQRAIWLVYYVMRGKLLTIYAHRGEGGWQLSPEQLTAIVNVAHPPLTLSFADIADVYRELQLTTSPITTIERSWAQSVKCALANSRNGREAHNAVVSAIYDDDHLSNSEKIILGLLFTWKICYYLYDEWSFDEDLSGVEGDCDECGCTTYSALCGSGGGAWCDFGPIAALAGGSINGTIWTLPEGTQSFTITLMSGGATDCPIVHINGDPDPGGRLGAIGLYNPYTRETGASTLSLGGTCSGGGYTGGWVAFSVAVEITVCNMAG